MSTTPDPNEWVDRYGEALYSYAFARMNDSNAASDAVQETFLRALRKLSTFENQSSLKTWLIGILRNVIFEHSRQRNRRHQEMPPENEPLLTLAEMQTLPPDEVIQRSEFWETVEHCLERLPTKSARIFWENEVEHRPIKELAEQLDTTSNNVSAQLYRARKSMRECMAYLWKKIAPKK